MRNSDELAQALAGAATYSMLRKPYVRYGALPLMTLRITFSFFLATALSALPCGMQWERHLV